MKDYIEERAVEVAYYIIETKATVRQAAKKFGISKSTVHKDCTERLQQTIRGVLEAGATAVVVRDDELCDTLQNLGKKPKTAEKAPKKSLKEELEAKIAESAKAEEERKNKTTGRKPAAKSRRNKQQEK